MQTVFFLSNKHLNQILFYFHSSKQWLTTDSNKFVTFIAMRSTTRALFKLSIWWDLNIFFFQFSIQSNFETFLLFHEVIQSVFPTLKRRILSHSNYFFFQIRIWMKSCANFTFQTMNSQIQNDFVVESKDTNYIIMIVISPWYCKLSTILQTVARNTKERRLGGRWHAIKILVGRLRRQ